MSKYDKLKGLSCDDFRRLIGVKKVTFSKMLEILHPIDTKKRLCGGRPPKLCLEDRLLMSLEYLREYRTYFHLGKSYEISEGTCYKTCCWIEKALINNPLFHLPGKKALLDSDRDYEIILVDATESPVERPKKNE